MRQHSLDATHGWAHTMWNALADHAYWGVPRSGMVYQKQGDKLALIDRMPVTDELAPTGFTPEELRFAQDEEHRKITEHFNAIGVEVTDETKENA